MENALVYVADPLCSWCYGFSPEITQVKKAFPTLDFQLIMGGLRPHGMQIIHSMKDFLREHWDHVHQRSGVPFNYGILENDSFLYDTEPPCRAVVAVRKIAPAVVLPFFKGVQKAFYVENQDTSDFETYRWVARKVGIDDSRLEEVFRDAETISETENDFKRSRAMGINGFPTVVFRRGQQHHLVSRGYETAAHIADRIRELLTG